MKMTSGAKKREMLVQSINRGLFTKPHLPVVTANSHLVAATSGQARYNRLIALGMGDAK